MGQEAVQRARSWVHQAQKVFSFSNTQILCSGSPAVRGEWSHNQWDEGIKWGHESLKVKRLSQLEAENVKKSVCSKMTIKEVTAVGSEEKPGLPDKWVKKIQHLEHLIKNLQLAFPTCRSMSLPP